MNKKSMRIFLAGGKTFAILVMGIMIGFGALCMVHMLPVEKIHQNVLNSRNAINVRGEVVQGYKSTSIDNFTDSIILNQVICPVDAPLLEKAVYNYQVNYWQKYEQPENLLRYLDGETGYKYQGYTHYWGGYLVILKPLLMIFDYADVLVINIIIQTLLAVLIILGLCKSGKDYVVIPFVAAIISIMPVSMAVCLQLCDIYYIALAGTALIVWGHKKIRSERMYLLFLLLGMSTSYFDFLTYPFVSLGIPLVVFLVYLDKEKLINKFFYIILCSAQWCVGYVGMWAGKWILGSILVPEGGSFKVAIKQIIYRGSNRSSDNQKLTVFSVTLENLFVYLKWPVMILIGAVMIYLLYKIIKGKNVVKNRALSAVPYLLICIYPLVWYMIAKNHSYEHSFMAYRELVIATFAGLCMLAEIGFADREKVVSRGGK